MDEGGDYRQIINIAAPPVEDVGSQAVAGVRPHRQRGLAEMVRKHPDRFA
jgi:aminocarboxymuconate-semialdehyde decarboxylase